jgi:mycothiol synthase
VKSHHHALALKEDGDGALAAEAEHVRAPARIPLHQAFFEVGAFRAELLTGRDTGRSGRERIHDQPLSHARIVPSTIVRRLLAPPTRAADLSLRPATLDDAAFVAELYTALDPDEPKDPVLLRYQWENAPADQVVQRLLVMRENARVGAAGFAHASWEKLPKRYVWVWADLLPAVRTGERLDALHETVEDLARRDGAAIFSTGARESDDFRIRYLAERGYREERRGRFWELDLTSHGRRLLAMAEASRERMRSEGIQVLTLAADTDSEKYRKLWRCAEEAGEDMPATIPYVHQPLEQFMKWVRRPGIFEDRLWIARAGDEIVGMSLLRYPPVRGNVTTAWTGTARALRGRGIARALKLETIAQAMGLGTRRIRTGNDAENAPILHLNEELGYDAIPGWIEFLKDA